MKQRRNYYAPMMSRDYEKLKKLLDDDNVVICFVDYEYNTGGRTITFRDVAKAKTNEYSPNSKNYGYVVEARGIVYANWDRRMQEIRDLSFEDECERLNLEYIDYGDFEN